MMNAKPIERTHQHKALRTNLVRRSFAGLIAGLAVVANFPTAVFAAELTSAVASTALAPTGVLRVVINVGNPILARKDAQSGVPVGVSVDLATELANRLKTPLALIPVNSAGNAVDLVTREMADIGFFAIDPVRGQGIAFTPAYVQIEGSYLVRDGSPIKSNEEVDRPGHRIVVGKGSAYDLFLTREIKQAQLVRADTSPEVVRYFVENNHEVAAGVRQQLESDARSVPGLRLLGGRFMVIDQAMGAPKSRTDQAHGQLRQFVNEMKSSGFVAASLKRHGIDGAVVAP
jgi:polar amino acid transport system substrate-binding protein